jgi:hypothetical protein
MDVIALVYSLAVLVWVIICLVSGNSQFGGTGSAPWIIYIISHVCLQMIPALGEAAPPLVPWKKSQKLFVDCYKYRMLRLKQTHL